MRQVLLLFLIAASYAHSQSPQDLLRSAEETYKNPEGYEIKGTGTVQLPNSSWQMSFEVTIAAGRSPLPSPGQLPAPAVPGVILGAHHLVSLGADKTEKPPSVSIPFAVTGGWTTRIAERVVAVKEIGSETLPLNGAAVPCRILQVNYEPDDNEPADTDVVTYSICSEKHLVLKETRAYAYSAGRRLTDPPAQWTLTFDSARFNLPTPQWLIDLRNQPSLKVRKEWVGRAAPDFVLPDLDGASVKLSSLRGKVVLLDFWSITCGPCLREMPMVEAVGESYKTRNVALWGISFDRADRSKKWLLEHQHDLPTLTDADFVVSELYKVQGIPSLVLVGRDGKIKNYWMGEVPRPDLEASIRRALRR